jgi:hypothetical protein
VNFLIRPYLRAVPGALTVCHHTDISEEKVKYPRLPGETFNQWLGRVQPLRRRDLEERIRAGGLKPATTADLATWPRLFESDAEHEAFLAWLHEERRRHVL